MMILDYSEFIEDSVWSSGPPLTKHEPTTPGLFFAKRGKCPFCKTLAPKVCQKPFGEPQFNRAWGWYEVWECPTCGWWEIKEDFEMDMIEELSSSEVLKHAILKTFDPSDAKLPVLTLRKTLKRRPEIIYNIHPRKLEQLVQSVFSDFYACEVEHCGRTGDGGVDLIIVNGDRPVLVQVKRRTKALPSESVVCVREFLGAMVLNRAQRGIFVTTASNFSSHAKRAASEAISIGAVDEFQLFNLDRLLEMLNLIKDGAGEPSWKGYVPKD